MGHRKHSAPRRGSLAYSPRTRAHGLIPRVRAWAETGLESPSLGGFICFKVGMLHMITVDDREKTPNFGKPLFVPGTVLASPPVRIVGLRAYGEADGRHFVLKDVYDPDFELFARSKKKTPVKEQVEALKVLLAKTNEVWALIAVRPSEAGLSQKTHLLCEVPILGGSVEQQIDFGAQNIGKSLPAHRQLSPGSFVDVASVSRGRGFEGPVTRFGVKRKQHKSRKSVRAVGVLSPWHPHDVMYTVARAGQMGYHQRVEYNHKVMAVGDEKSLPLTPSGGFPHFGNLRGEYILVKGSVPGPSRRPVIVRYPVRVHTTQVKPPQVVFVSTRQGRVGA
jgi:large subunit ribosomal protein L3